MHHLVLTAPFADIAHMLAVLGDLLAALAADLGHMLAIFRDLLAALAADLGHMLAILRDLLAALVASFAGLLGSKLMSGPLLMGRLPAFARDLALFLLVHRRKATLARIAILACHVYAPCLCPRLRARLI